MRLRPARRPTARRALVPWLAAAFCLASLLGAAAGAEEAGRTPAPEGAAVYIIAPVDGATVSSPVRVQFGLRGMGVAPASVAFANTGHHHLLVDVDLPPLDAPVPADARHQHFGAGQTETTLELPPGEHKLQLLLGDQDHVPHDPPIYSEPVTITVE